MADSSEEVKMSLIALAQAEQWKLLSMSLNHFQLYSTSERDNDNNSILHILAQKNVPKDYDLISKIVTFIDVNDRNSDGKIPLHVAVQHNRPETAKELIEHGAGVNLLNKYGHSALYYATLVGNVKMVQLLYTNGCDLNYEDRERQNVLHLAARLNHKKLIAFFMTKNVDIDARNTWGQTPLEVALEAGNSEIALVLINSGADTSIFSNKHDGSLLHRSAKLGDVLVTTILLRSKSILIHQLDTEQRTPLHLAVQGNHDNIVQMLLKKGSDVNVADADGYTSLHIAVQNGFLKILNLFIVHSKPMDDSNTTNLSKDEQLFDLEKLDFYKVTNAGDNILHLLAASSLQTRRKMDVFYVLLKLNLKKLVVNVNKDFRTPLHLAYYAFCRPLISVFVNLGADEEEIDKFGKKPRDYCVLPDGGRFKVIKKISFNRRFITSTNY